MTVTIVQGMDDPSSRSNRVLSLLSAADRALLQPYLREVELREGECLHRAGEIVSHIIFPIGAVVALTASIQQGRSIGLAVIGGEGMVGNFTEVPFALSDAHVVVTGGAFQVSHERFHDAVCRSRSLRDLVSRADAALMARVQQSAVCNAAHSSEERVCRFLLDIHDRTRCTGFPVTQDLVARLLSLRRTTVTYVSRRLRSARAVQWRRGRVYVTDRKRLEQAACECYARANDLMLALLPEPARRDESLQTRRKFTDQVRAVDLG